MWEQKPEGGFPFFSDAFDVRIVMPLKIRSDLDNMIKPLLDFLADPARIIANDKHTRSASISRSEDIAKGMCRVFVYETKVPA
jgi:Holliday junction resolvase RusA-like endonuclease